MDEAQDFARHVARACDADLGGQLSELVDLRKVDQAWFLRLLREGESGRGRAPGGAKAAPRAKAGAIKVGRPDDLPSEYGCNLCGRTKPVGEMIVVHLKREDVYYLRPRCKECQNARERGHRRAWKREYLRRWREKNAERNEGYWKGNQAVKERARVNAARRFDNHHDAILIRGRMSRAGAPVSLEEAERLLNKFGRCYPTRFGLTPEGRRECERIRSTMRRRPSVGRLSAFEIRRLVYGKELFIEPGGQPKPYRKAAERLRELRRGQKAERLAA